MNFRTKKNTGVGQMHMLGKSDVHNEKGSRFKLSNSLRNVLHTICNLRQLIVKVSSFLLKSYFLGAIFILRNGVLRLF